MTTPDGFSSDMNPFALDAGTAERMVTGSVDVGDAPPKYRAVAATLSGLRAPPELGELVGGSVAAEGIAAAVVAERTESMPRSSRRSASRTRVLVASIAACGLVVTGGLTAAGALPESAQRIASAVLDRVGISVPSGDEEPVDHEIPPPTTADPTPTPADSGQSAPTGVGLQVPAPAPDDVGASSTPGPDRTEGVSRPTAGGAPPPAVTDDSKQSAAGAPPGNGTGNGDGNAYGLNGGNGNGKAHGLTSGNGNGNAYGHENVHGAEAGP